MGLDDEYINAVYGKAADWIAYQTNYAIGAAYYPLSSYTECYGDNAVDVQCEIVGENMEIDPSLLTYDQRLKIFFKEFCYSTSSHGIPMIGRARNPYTRLFWTILYVICFCVFVYNAKGTIDQYLAHEKTVDIELVFDPPPFPAITLCNLNPYKFEEIKKVPLVMMTELLFSNVTDVGMYYNYTEVVLPTMPTVIKRRDKRDEAPSVQSKMPSFQPMFFACACQNEFQCVAANENHMKPASPFPTLCICAYDSVSEVNFLCLPRKLWAKPQQCLSCAPNGQCTVPMNAAIGTRAARCLCANMNGNVVCIEHSHPKIGVAWIALAPPTVDPGFYDALGFEGVTDEVALLAQAKENIMFAMFNQTEAVVEKVSYTRADFIHKCSFNGKGCDMDNDFVIHKDPSFANCFTFNSNQSVQVTTDRAGPMNGLRLIVYVNVDNYLPTTESAGIKLTIQEQSQYPYPDTFGYSAPVGYISSFGVKLKRMKRLPAPFGECEADGREKTRIFDGYAYSMEFFRDAIGNVIKSVSNLNVDVMILGNLLCLTVLLAMLSVQHQVGLCMDEVSNSEGHCHCIPPCAQALFQVTFSASVWPSPSLQVQLGMCDKSHHECVQHYKDNGGMVEVFYETLSYEMLKENEAYGFITLLSDFGGQFGLWLGLSMLSCFEFVFLAFNLSALSAEHHFHQKRQAQEAEAARRRKPPAI